jgi:ribosomal protein S18 acetylase RimI-like enzyme
MNNLRTVAFQSKELRSFLKDFSTTNLYPEYICKRAPTALATLYQNHEIQGALFNGPGNRIFESCAQWILTKKAEVAKHLLTLALENDKRWDIEIPHKIIPQAELAMFPADIGHDLLMEMNWNRFPSINTAGNFEIRELHRESPTKEHVDPWVEERTGQLCDWSSELPLYVVLADKKIVAVCEALVRDPSGASIGQLATRREFRGRGYARSLVHHVCRFLREKKLSPHYLVAANNTPSVNLAASLGFQTVAEFDCIVPKRV